MLEAAKGSAHVSKSNTKSVQAVSQDTSHSDEAQSELLEIPAMEVLSELLDFTVALAYLPAWVQPVFGRLPMFRDGYDAAPKLANLSLTAVANRVASQTDRADMLSELLRGRDEEGKPYGLEELSTEAELLIIAGGDTTAK